MLNAFVLGGFVKPVEHRQVGHSKRDILDFKMELAHQLINGFSSRQRPGRPRSDAHQQLNRLQPSHKHWPEHVKKKLDCVVCAGRALRNKLPSRGRPG